MMIAPCGRPLNDLIRPIVSGTVKDLGAGSGIKFVERGTHTLKGVPGEWPLYAVAST